MVVVVVGGSSSSSSSSRPPKREKPELLTATTMQSVSSPEHGHGSRKRSVFSQTPAGLSKRSRPPNCLTTYGQSPY